MYHYELFERMSMPPTILIVEDSPVFQKLLVRLLVKKNYSVLTADSGELGIKSVRESLPDLILLDIIMPGIDGYDVCRWLKSNARTMHIPVIFISTLDSPRDKIEGFEVGGIDYITKPFQPSEVLLRVRTHLRIHHLQQKLEEKNQQLIAEKQKSERLLCHVLPEPIVQELLSTGTCVPQLFPETTVCFTDIVGFTAASSKLAPEVLIHELNEIFTVFDEITHDCNCERMKTIGDAYLFVSGVPMDDLDHAVHVGRAAMKMIDFLHKRNQTARLSWQVRIGINSGPVVGGVVGTEKYLYDIFGDTVNISARMEKSAQPMEINVSSASYELLKDTFRFSNGHSIEMKGKGQQVIYTLLGDM